MNKLDLEEIEKDVSEVREWHEKYRQQLENYYIEINEKLKSNRLKEREQLLVLFQNQQFQSIFYKDAVIAQISIILGIYQMEIEDKKKHTILDHGSNIDELTDYFLSLKFKVWRLEMEFDDESKDAFLDFISQYDVTIHALKYIIHTSCFDKANTSVKIGSILKQKQMAAMAFGMLNYALELCPGEEMILCEMADICVMNKQYDMARQLVGMIGNSTGFLAEYQRKWGLKI